MPPREIAARPVLAGDIGASEMLPTFARLVGGNCDNDTCSPPVEYPTTLTPTRPNVIAHQLIRSPHVPERAQRGSGAAHPFNDFAYDRAPLPVRIPCL